MSRQILNAAPRPTGKQIRKALIDLDLSVLELANAMDVSPIYIRMIYQERRKARQLRRRIAKHIAAEYKRQGGRVPNAFKPTKELP